MKNIFLILLLSSSSMARANTTQCFSDGPELTVDFNDQGEIISAFWQNPNWSNYGEHYLDLSQLQQSGRRIRVSDDQYPEANTDYICEANR